MATKNLEISENLTMFRKSLKMLKFDFGVTLLCVYRVVIVYGSSNMARCDCLGCLQNASAYFEGLTRVLATANNCR